MSDDKLKRKKLQDFLEEDKSLTEKISYEEFLKKKAAPNNTDDSITEVYEKYKKITAVL